MPVNSKSATLTLHTTGLALAIAAAFGLGVPAVAREPDSSAIRRPDASEPGHPSAVPHEVTNCNDDGSPGSLRQVIASATTLSGDTVDLSNSRAA